MESQCARIEVVNKLVYQSTATSKGSLDWQKPPLNSFFHVDAAVINSGDRTKDVGLFVQTLSCNEQLLIIDTPASQGLRKDSEYSP